MPSPSDMADAFPFFASWIKVEGAAVVRCTVVAAGRLGNCDALGVTPAGLGFDRAAISLTPRFRLHPRTVDGEPAKSQVAFIVRFHLEPEKPLPIWTGLTPPAGDVIRIRSMMATFAEKHGPPSLDEENIDVDDGRRNDVMAMVAKVDAEFMERDMDGIALAMARTLTEAQMTALFHGTPLPGEPPDEETLVAAGAEHEVLQREKGRRLRELYCERYDCTYRR